MGFEEFLSDLQKLFPEYLEATVEKLMVSLKKYLENGGYDVFDESGEIDFAKLEDLVDEDDDIFVTVSRDRLIVRILCDAMPWTMQFPIGFTEKKLSRNFFVLE